jgi:hypothetical protein
MKAHRRLMAALTFVFALVAVLAVAPGASAYRILNPSGSPGRVTAVNDTSHDPTPTFSGSFANSQNPGDPIGKIGFPARSIFRSPAYSGAQRIVVQYRVFTFDTVVNGQPQWKLYSSGGCGANLAYPCVQVIQPGYKWNTGSSNTVVPVFLVRPGTSDSAGDPYGVDVRVWWQKNDANHTFIGYKVYDYDLQSDYYCATYHCLTDSLGTHNGYVRLFPTYP